MKKNITTIIEITNTHVKFYQFRNDHNKRVMAAFDVRPITDFTDDQIIEILIGMLRSKSVRAENVIVIVARRQVILKQMRLPSKEKEEIVEMAELQLINKIPYSIEDVSYQCTVLGEDGPDHSRVLVIIVHKEVSDRYLKIFRGAGLNLSRLALSSFGILEWLNDSKREGTVMEDGPLAVVDIDIDYTEICFCHEKKLLFSRSFDVGAKDLNEESIFRLTKQIEMSLGMYKKEDIGPPVREVIVLSSLSVIDLLKEKLEKQLRIPAKIIMPADHAKVEKGLSLSAVKEEPGISLSVGLGLGCSDLKSITNLAPQEVHETKQGKIRKQKLMKFAVLLVLACVLGASIPALDLYFKSNFLNELKSEVNEIKPKASEALLQMKFIQALNTEFGDRVYISDLMFELYDLLPPEISFRSLNLKANGRLTIQGYAQSGGSVNVFQSALLRSKMFKDVHLQSTMKRRIFNREIMDFKIDTQLTKAGVPDHD